MYNRNYISVNRVCQSVRSKICGFCIAFFVGLRIAGGLLLLPFPFSRITKKFQYAKQAKIYKKIRYRWSFLPTVPDLFASILFSNYSSTVILSSFQISSTYSWMVRSELNLPEFATFRIAAFAQRFSSR